MAAPGLGESWLGNPHALTAEDRCLDQWQTGSHRGSFSLQNLPWGTGSQMP